MHKSSLKCLTQSAGCFLRLQPRVEGKGQNVLFKVTHSSLITTGFWIKTPCNKDTTETTLKSPGEIQYIPKDLPL